MTKNNVQQKSFSEKIIILTKAILLYYDS